VKHEDKNVFHFTGTPFLVVGGGGGPGRFPLGLAPRSVEALLMVVATAGDLGRLCPRA